MTDEQFEEVANEARAWGISFNTCPTCGSKREEVAPGVYEWPNTATFKYLNAMHRCFCEEQDTLRRHYLLAHIPQKYWRYSLEDYYGDPNALQVAQEYILGFNGGIRSQGIGIEFYSPSQGSGKTFLATWIARQLVQQGQSIYYTRFRSLMGLHNNPNKLGIEKRLKYSTALILDEVGYGTSDAQTGYFSSEFEDLVRARVDNALPTIMTTNMLPDELDKYYPRIYSVLAGAQERHEVNYEDVRRKGDTLMFDKALIKKGEIRPIC